MQAQNGQTGLTEETLGTSIGSATGIVAEKEGGFRSWTKDFPENWGWLMLWRYFFGGVIGLFIAVLVGAKTGTTAHIPFSIVFSGGAYAVFSSYLDVVKMEYYKRQQNGGDC